MDKQKKQHKPIVCRKHTIIERERLLAHEDIINDTQYSGKEEGTQIVAYWKDEETGETLVSDAYSKGKLKGSGWYFPTALKQPEVPIYDWTPNYAGQGYVEIPEWHGVAGDSITGTFIIDDLSVSNEIFDSTDRDTRLYFFFRVGGSKYDIPSGCELEIDLGVEGKILPRSTYNFKIKIKSGSYTVTSIGGNHGNFRGSITLINQTKADGSDNRFYDSVIKSETEPETLVLEDSISGKHGTLKNFPVNAVWKEVTTQLPVGEHTLKEGELISFTRDSYAWLDGKSYAPNEPRYTADGELLVEGQATNARFDFFALSDGIYSYYYAIHNIVGMGSVSLLDCVSNKESPSWHARSKYDVIPESYGTVYCTSVFEFRDGLTSVDNRGLIGLNCNCVDSIPVLGVSGNCEVTSVRILSGFVVVEYVCITDEKRTWETFNYSNKIKIGEEFSMGVVQISSVHSSYIPTTTTAVTRAADIATVRSIN